MSFFLRGCIVASLSATLFAIPALAQNSVGIGTTTPNASSALDIVSTAGGVLLPRLTQVQRLAIATPAKGLLVFQTDGTSPGFWYNAGTALAPFWTPFLIANDNLGNHTATTDLNLNGNRLSGGGSGNVGLPGSTTLELGNGVAGKNAFAGKIGYQTFSDGLDIVGAGTGFTDRKIKLWAEGGLTINTLAGTGTRVVTADALGNLASVATSTLGADNLGNHTATTALTLGDNPLRLRNDAFHQLRYDATVNGAQLFGFDGGQLGFNQGTYTPVLSWNTSSNVGIGTTAPTARLDVDGSTRLRGLTVAGVVTTDASGNLTSVAANTLGNDNLGNHTATTTLNLNGNALSGGGSNNVGIVSGTTLELGSGVAGKDVFAGKIGYQAFTADALDIVGAGTNGANRKIKLWAEGGLTINTLAGTGTRVVTADASGNLASVASSSLTDNLGNHTATTALNMQGNILTGSGASVSGVGVGVRADGGLNLGQNTVGNNVNLGYNAGFGLTTGADNTFVGFQSGRDATGSANAFLGRDTGYNTTGSNNTFAGYQAGVTNTTGANNTALGHQAGPSGAGLSNTTAIGYQAQAGQSNALVLGGTGLNAVSVGIGTATPTATLDVVGGTRLRGLTTAGIVTTNASGVLSSVAASTLGDNLGNHTATQTLVLNDNVLRLRNDAFHQLRYDGGPDGPQLFGFGGGQLGFNQGTYTPVLSWNTSSNVGIGTTAPTARLDVAGTIRLRTLTTAGIVTTDANGNLTSVAASSLADNLGNHTATTTLNLNGNALSGGSSNNVGIVSGTTLELGNGVAGKDANAGKIGYNAFGSGALDIVGAGTTGSNRKVKIWAEGGTLINSLAGTGTRMVTTDASGNLGSAAITSGAADNLGNHTATTTLNLITTLLRCTQQ